MKKLDYYIKQSDRQFAFIDECGNYGFDFDKPDVSSHFIICAVIIGETLIRDLEDRLEKIRKTYFQTGEMKSSGIGDNHNRRTKILNDISMLDFHYYAVVVDKKRIFNDSGLMYKKTFFKYLNNKLHNELYLSFPKLHLVADSHGNKEFMDGFVEYVNSKHQPNLFEEYEFGFDNSKNNILIQLADIIAGTISYKYEASKISGIYNTFEEFIGPKRIGQIEWPISYENYIYEYEKHNPNNYDRVIYTNSFRLVIDYIKQHENSIDQESRERVYVLRYLLTTIESGGNSRYVNSKELINNLRILMKREYTNHYFKTSIIAKMRDEKLLIASSNKGYKIPESEEDIYNFVNQTNLMIEPMLSRLKMARDRIKLATKGELDILDKAEYKKLKKYIDN